MAVSNARFKGLYYITHVDNVPSILEHGILSHDRIDREGIPFTPIYNEDIVALRHDRLVAEGNTLWHYANVYFQPRNAMLYQVTRRRPVEDIAVLGVRPDIVNRPDMFISTGNAASYESEILPAPKGIKIIRRIVKAADKKWWSPVDRSKREMMAECLVPDQIPPDLVQEVYVANHAAAQNVRQACSGLDISVIPEPYMFFEPSRKIQLTLLLSLVSGDMFFSRMHTLTVSVNCVGVMGKGLASRAKYQFPDVYVKYEDVCRSKTLRMGKPYLYKRESSVEQVLADEPSAIPNGSGTWFLLFATKAHWREPADFGGIEAGLQWLVNNYRSAGIKSLAIPALGCGLGRLQWKDVGPLMTHYLSSLDIPVEIYLPAEKQISDELLASEFLLS